MTDNAEFPEVLNLKLRETTLSFKKWDPNYGNHIPGIYHYYSATPTNSEWTIDVDFCKNKYVKGEWRASTYWTEASNDDNLSFNAESKISAQEALNKLADKTIKLKESGIP